MNNIVSPLYTQYGHYRGVDTSSRAPRTDHISFVSDVCCPNAPQIFLRAPLTHCHPGCPDDHRPVRGLNYDECGRGAHPSEGGGRLEDRYILRWGVWCGHDHPGTVVVDGRTPANITDTLTSARCGIPSCDGFYETFHHHTLFFFRGVLLTPIASQGCPDDHRPVMGLNYDECVWGAHPSDGGETPRRLIHPLVGSTVCA